MAFLVPFVETRGPSCSPSISEQVGSAAAQTWGAAALPPAGCGEIRASLLAGRAWLRPAADRSFRNAAKGIRRRLCSFRVSVWPEMARFIVTKGKNGGSRSFRGCSLLEELRILATKGIATRSHTFRVGSLLEVLRILATKGITTRSHTFRDRACWLCENILIFAESISSVRMTAADEQCE